MLLSIGAPSVVAASEQPELKVRLEVLLTTTPVLPEGARAAMISEASAIWRNQGVAIEWLPATANRPVSHDRLRVLVLLRRQSAASSGGTLTVGELLRNTDAHPVAIVSLETALRLVASVRGGQGSDMAVADRRLGLVLGRAMAHEIGHFLLNTHTHALSGLMRSQFHPREFTDLRDGTFVLDRKAAEWLKSRPHERFAYVR